MRRIIVTVALVATTAFGTACSSDDSVADCADIYAKGEVISTAQAEQGCRLPNGTILDDNACERVDGVLLVTYDKSDPPLWGLADEPLQAAPDGLDDDEAYQEAVALC